MSFVLAFVYRVDFCLVLGSINMEIAYHLDHTLYLLTSIKDATRLIAENGFLAIDRESLNKTLKKPNF
jgi:hypothetical protein